MSCRRLRSGLGAVDFDTDVGLLTVKVESAAGVMGCGSCGVVVHSRGRREIVLVDAACLGRPVTNQKSPTGQQPPGVRPDHRLSCRTVPGFHRTVARATDSVLGSFLRTQFGLTLGLRDAH